MLTRNVWIITLYVVGNTANILCIWYWLYLIWQEAELLPPSSHTTVRTVPYTAVHKVIEVGGACSWVRPAPVCRKRISEQLYSCARPLHSTRGCGRLWPSAMLWGSCKKSLKLYLVTCSD